jgi:mycothiol synthase
MSSSLPDGFRLRGATAVDVEIAAGIVHAEEEELRGTSDWGAAEMSMFWRHANLDDGTWIVETSGGDPAAFAATMERGNEVDSWAAVHPKYLGRGLSTALLTKVEERAMRDGLRAVKAGMFAENIAAAQLFERLGYREARHYYQMRIDFDGPPDPPEPPPGVVFSTFRPEDARTFHSTLNDVFAEEWGFHEVPFDEWKRTRLEASDTDTSLWFIARDGEKIAGVARCDGKKHGGGWVGAVGVRKPWRQRGIGLALLQHVFVEFQRRGEPHVGLGVDAENPTGATRLYERAGMRVIKEDIVFEKKLT